MAAALIDVRPTGLRRRPALRSWLRLFDEPIRRLWIGAQEFSRAFRCCDLRGRSGPSEGVAAGCATHGASSAEVLRRPCGLGASVCRSCRRASCRLAICRRMVWVTRSRPKIDRIACPWLIRRFVDPHCHIPLRLASGSARGRRAFQRRAVRYRRRLLEPPGRPLHLRYDARRTGLRSNRSKNLRRWSGRGHRAPRSCARSAGVGRRFCSGCRACTPMISSSWRRP